MKKFLVLLISYLLVIPNVLALNNYKVTFIIDDGFKNTVEVEENNTVIEPEFSREGYTLVGFTNDGILFDFNTPINSDITLVAVWEKIEESKGFTSQENNINSENNATINRGYSDLSEELKYLIIGIPVVIVIIIKYFLVPYFKKTKENKN